MVPQTLYDMAGGISSGRLRRQLPQPIADHWSLDSCFSPCCLTFDYSGSALSNFVGLCSFSFLAFGRPEGSRSSPLIRLSCCSCLDALQLVLVGSGGVAFQESAWVAQLTWQHEPWDDCSLVAGLD
jgi:hypothetical protein